MNILVYSVAASSSGALSILDEYYQKCMKKQENHYIFLVSVPFLESIDNIKILRFPWIKKNWIYRLFFEYVIAPHLVYRYKIDYIFSLTNTVIPFVKVPQIVYLQQSLPFSKYKFTVYENPKIWIYQNLIGVFVKHAIKKAYKVIVQTHWIKKACIDQCKVDSNKIVVKEPHIDELQITQFNIKLYKNIFFYPAIPLIYKNHMVILESLNLLKTWGITDYKVIFTTNGMENKLAGKLRKYVNIYQLPVDFQGMMSRQEVFSYYSSSVLLFPSFIETFGLPLKEAKMSNTPIIVSDTDFSHEVLNKYDKVIFCEPFNSNAFAAAMRKYIFNN